MPIDKGFEVVILVVMFVMFYFKNGLTNDKKRGKAYSKRIYNQLSQALLATVEEVSGES